MPKLNLYSAWMDPVFYVWGLLFAAAIVAMLYSIRRYIELKNAAGDAADEPAEENPFVEAAGQPDLQSEEEPESRPEPRPESRPEPRPAPQPAAEAPRPEAGGNRAENFVRGIYEGISGIDARLKGIEARLSKGGSTEGDFTVKFLEDIVQDIDGLDKSKIKARLQYLITDLKK